MLDYSFVNNIDNFHYISGTIPILLIGSHAYCDNSITEEKMHLCDFFVSPFLKEINNKYPHLFYILENQVPRSIIDMNRKSARHNDLVDSNDYFFRQTIRFICQYLNENYKKTPILIDVHSFDIHDEWNKNDLMILEQIKKGAETNKYLMNQTINFFRERKWKIDSTTKHNQDDIVEEMADKELSIPLLIEFNESILRDNKRFNKMINDFAEYLKYIDKLNLKFIKSNSDSYIVSKIILDNLDQNKKIDIKNPILKKAFTEYLDSLQSLNSIISKNKKNSKISNGNIGYDSLSELNKEIHTFSNYGKNDTEIIKKTIYTISNQHDTIIIPIELLLLCIKILYGNINKTQFQEWGINIDQFISSLLTNANDNSEFGIVIPKYHKNSIINDNILFNKYYISNKEPSFYSFFIILFDNINKISESGLKEDLELLNKWINYDEIYQKNNGNIYKIKKQINDTIF